MRRTRKALAAAVLHRDASSRQVRELTVRRELRYACAEVEEDANIMAKNVWKVIRGACPKPAELWRLRG